MSSQLPVIRLKPKADARLLAAGHPWVFADQLVTDRRTKALAPGTIAELQDAARAPIGIVAVNPGSKIMVRVMTRNMGAVIDRAWIGARIRAALALRERLYDQPFYRLIHAEADGLPGVIVDRFGEVAVIQPNAAWAENMLDDIVSVLLDETGCRTIYKNASGRARGLEGLDEESSFLAGSPAGIVEVPMNGATYMADLAGGQKTGLFYDQRENHAFAARLAKDARVLDMFSHVGGFGLATLAAGAAEVLAVDGSAPALELAEKGAVRSGFDGRFATRKGDAFKVMEALTEEGAQFDLVVADPPAFTPTKQSLQNGLRAYSRVAMMAASLTAPGGFLVLCSCSHAADLEKFRIASLRGVGRAGRAAQVLHTGYAGPDHPMHPQLGESGYLKALFLRLS